MPDPDHHAFLCLLAESLAESLAAGADAALVHVVYRGAGPDVGILPLDGGAPAEYLLGTVAPAEWSALGVATRGRAGPLSGPGPSSTAEVVVLVPRVGEVVGRMRHAGRMIDAPPAYGLTVDCIQRALGLPTAPPLVPPVHAVRDAAKPDEALAVLKAGGFLTWERLRQLAVEGHLQELTLAPEDAAWFDEGSFSRWVLGGRPPLPVLLAEVAAQVGFAEARGCAGVLQDMGIDVTLPARRERRRRRAG
jgi:hypothetical protein